MGEPLHVPAPRTANSYCSGRARWSKRVSVGTRLCNARLAAGMTLVDLADELTTPAYLSRIEANERRPSSALLSGLARVLGIDIGDLTHGETASADKLQFELAHADALLASGQFADAFRVSADLAEVARSMKAPGVADAAHIVGASALAAAGQPQEALRIVRALSDGELGLLALIAQTSFHMASSEFHRAIEVGRFARDLSSGCGVSLPKTAELAVTLAGAYEALGHHQIAGQVATEALRQLCAEIGPHAGEAAPAADALLVFYGSFRQFATQVERAVAELQSARLNADIRRLRRFAIFDSASAAYPLAQMAVR